MVLNKRSRPVSFRLSEKEFQLLQQVVEGGGFRSVSEFAREVVMRAANDGYRPGDAGLAGSGDLQKSIEKLTQVMVRLMDMVETRQRPAVQ